MVTYFYNICGLKPSRHIFTKTCASWLSHWSIIISTLKPINSDLKFFFLFSSNYIIALLTYSDLKHVAVQQLFLKSLENLVYFIEQ